MGTIGENIRTFREAAHLTQDELADLAHINRVTLFKYESGKVNPGAKVVMRLANALHIRPDVLLGIEEFQLSDDERELWEVREQVRREPERMELYRLTKNASIKDIRQVNAFINAMRATNPDFYDGDDEA